ncbi:hypothetical protein BDV27DRAFT_127379 [Aspergillus caelatus]|uniref:Uncharacterized protein n=1 Tax=Aspergillus caelatus TaxID=61420 RepID=A0A5N7A5N9_9EURO|nr:uncharacterized protein BDV27DRAFT_127379 [Aspergillus caelatus]KAE8365174.1 hypothetical protein BDV27DRAFT_127379 [Aspergillus caelatus]
MPVGKRIGLQVVGDQFLGNDYSTVCTVHWIGFLCGWENIRMVHMVMMSRIVFALCCVCIQLVALETWQMFMYTCLGVSLLLLFVIVVK